MKSRLDQDQMKIKSSLGGRDFSHQFLFAGEDIRKQIVQSKVKLKNTGLRQNKKIFWGGSKILRGEENPAFPGKLALGKKPRYPLSIV